MTDVDSPALQRSQANDQLYAFAVYVLYGISFFTVVTAPLGVAIAHVRAGEAQGIWQSHFQFQIRTFWIGLLYLVTGIVLTTVMIGVLVLLWWTIWALVRIIKGAILLNDGRPIPQPNSWMFG